MLLLLNYAFVALEGEKVIEIILNACFRGLGTCLECFK